MKLLHTVNLFPVPLTLFDIDILEEEKEYLKTLPTGNDSPYLDNLATIDNTVLNKPQVSKLKKQLMNALNQYKKELLRCDDEIYITNSWVNFLPKFKSHALHQHTNSFVSGVLYIDINSDHPFIKFENPADLWTLNWKRNKFGVFNSLSHSETIRTGMLMLFPSKLWHSVDKNLAREPRISLSFNTFLKGNIKSNDYVADLELT